MRILISAAAARMGGARAHVLGFLPELAALAPADDVLLIGQPDLLAELPCAPANWTLEPEPAQARGNLWQLIWEQRVLPRIARRWGADVLLSFGSFVPLRSPCPTVLEAGNALPFTRAYWQLIGRAPPRIQIEELLRWALLRASLRSARRILAPTRAMRQDVLMRLPELGDRIDVAVWGVATIFHETCWREPPGCTVLGVSKHGINKEFDVLIRALVDLDVQVVMTGTPDESQWSRRSAALAADLGVSDRVRFAGDVPNTQIPELIRQARVLVFPTWCESFGLPLAEALAMGAPAVAANIPACREVGGDAACYYAPGDPQSLRSAIAGLLEQRGRTAELSAAARERGKRFRWRANAEAVCASLRRAVGA